MLFNRSNLLISLTLSVFIPFSPAFGVDGAQILFKEGKEAKIRDGYKTLQAAMRERARGKKSGDQVVELNLDGSSFFIDVGQIAALCKEPCRSFQVKQVKR